MTRRRLVLLALLAGLLAGVAAAAIAAGQDPAAPPAPRAAPTPGPVRLGPPRRPDDRLPDGRYDGGYMHTVVAKRSLRVERPTADPASGPGWAVRTFNGERRSIRGNQRTLARPLYRQAMRRAESCAPIAGRSAGCSRIVASRRRRRAPPGRSATAPRASGRSPSCAS